MSDGDKKPLADTTGMMLGGLAMFSVFWAALHTYFAFDIGQTPTFALVDAQGMLDYLVIVGASLVAFSVLVIINAARK